ncbi:MAG TPA: biliverdin-producing heme oxygenase [Chthoniobacteraceae bacterium]|jgi:heme oxygenase
MILDKLRSQTAAAHAVLESELDIAATIADAARYRRVLEKFLGFHSTAESRWSALPSWPIAGYDPREPRKSEWLRADLLTLGLTPDAVDELARPVAPVPVDDIATAFGCAYVLEGSALGGRQIARMLAPFPATERPRRFFTSNGADVTARWKTFREALEQFAATGEANEKIIEGAEGTFRSFRQWLS